MEIRALREYGLVSCYEEYLRLPLGVLEDARLVIVAEAQRAAVEARRARA